MATSVLSGRPPLVTFLVALFSFAFTFFVLSLVVASKDQLVNPDILSWNVFFDKVSKLDFCFSKESNPERLSHRGIVSRELKDDNNNDDEALNSTVSRSKVSVSVPFTSQFVKSIQDLVNDNSLMSDDSRPILAEGMLRLGHLHQSSFGKYKDMDLFLSLYLPQPDASASEQDVCVILEAPYELLRDLNSGHQPSNCSANVTAERTSTSVVTFLTHTRDHLPDEWCSNGTVIEMTYEEQPDWSVFVSAEDKELIQYHLMAMSGFLFALTAVAFLAAFCKVCGQKSGKVKKVGDKRGDMELLAQDAYED